MKKEDRVSQVDDGQGADEQRTEPYKQYGEGAAQSATQSSAASSSGASGSAGGQAGAMRKSILFIEDEQYIGELYMRALVKANYQVKIVNDGEEGYKEAATDAYDIILLDLMMPNMLGLEILKRLRTEQPNLKAKIIITTNLEQSKDRRAIIENQADGYLIKAEVTPHQLVDFLGRIK